VVGELIQDLYPQQADDEQAQGFASCSSVPRAMAKSSIHKVGWRA